MRIPFKPKDSIISPAESFTLSGLADNDVSLLSFGFLLKLFLPIMGFLKKLPRFGYEIRSGIFYNLIFLIKFIKAWADENDLFCRSL